MQLARKVSNHTTVVYQYYSSNTVVFMMSYGVLWSLFVFMYPVDFPQNVVGFQPMQGFGAAVQRYIENCVKLGMGWWDDGKG